MQAILNIKLFKCYSIQNDTPDLPQGGENPRPLRTAMSTDNDWGNQFHDDDLVILRLFFSYGCPKMNHFLTPAEAIRALKKMTILFVFTIDNLAWSSENNWHEDLGITAIIL